MTLRGRMVIAHYKFRVRQLRSLSHREDFRLAVGAMPSALNRIEQGSKVSPAPFSLNVFGSKRARGTYVQKVAETAM